MWVISLKGTSESLNITAHTENKKVAKGFLPGLVVDLLMF